MNVVESVFLRRLRRPDDLRADPRLNVSHISWVQIHAAVPCRRLWQHVHQARS